MNPVRQLDRRTARALATRKVACAARWPQLLGEVPGQRGLAGLRVEFEMPERAGSADYALLAWDPAGSLDHFRAIGPGVGAFRFHVASIESMFNLSQELTEDTRERVIMRLSDSRAGTARDLADLMRAYGPA